MSDFNTFKIFAAVSGFRVLVLANRLGCKTTLAREVHDNLIAKLEAMIADLGDDLETEHSLAGDRGTPEGDFEYDIYVQFILERSMWLRKEPIALLDPLDIVIEADGEFIYATRDDFTLVPPDELEGLGEIIEAINREVGTAFAAARVFKEWGA